jgi:hypothetical protein
MSVPAQSLFVGLVLAVLSTTAYLTGTPDAETGKVSPTALIPAGIGGLLAVLGGLSLAAPGLRKHAMHFAAMVGLVGFLGGFMPVVRGYSKTGSVDFGKPAVQLGLLMSVLCLAFVVMCVKSFIDARKARERAAATADPVI